MVSYFVRYRGAAVDAQAFLARYRTQHTAILRRFPQMKSLVLNTPMPSDDPFPVRPGGSALLAQMIFEDESALNAALHSQARKEARDDFALFRSFEGEITHEALKAEVLF